MSLELGSTLGVYKILAPIGAGGMGEVYRALDERLGREVAIKVLPDDVAKDEDRLARFEREAKLLGALNHPSVATLHGLEESGDKPFLIMELVEGETLSERIARGPLSLDETMACFIQIAEGLEAAHEKGIVHRDLKPANIKTTPDGRIKVMDFGLAKAFAGEDEAASESSQSPTLTKGTALGAIMGTASYMSPEQARGKTVDRRTDVWAFGCCLYEALTGRKSFDGETVTDILAGVVHKDPAWERLPASTPPAVLRLLRRCFAKDPKERLHDIADARLELKDALSDEPAAAAERTRSRSAPVLGAVALASLVIAVWSLTRSPDVPSKGLARYAIALPEGEELAVSVAGPAVAISPDGQTFAWIGRRNGTEQIYLRRASELEARLIEGTEGARDLFFSPDGRWVGFTVLDWLMKVSISGGAPVRIAEQHFPRGASWARDGSIIFSDRDGLQKVSADGGEPGFLATPDRARREKAFRFPDVLPDGSAVIFTSGDADMETWDEAVISVLSLETGEIRRLVEGGTGARYSPTGHLVYARGDRLLAVPFDTSSLEVTGTAAPVVDGVNAFPENGPAQFAISRDGSLLYAPGTVWEARHRVMRVSRAGNAEPLIESLRNYDPPVISPDGRTLAVSVHGANVSIWTYSLSRETLTPLVSGFNNIGPQWSPDGRHLVFHSDPEGQQNIFRLAADGSGQPELLNASKYAQIPESWSPDGELLLYTEGHPETGSDIGVLPVGREEPPRALLRTNAEEMAPRFSTDGRWVAHQSDESGRPEIYLRLFADPATKWQVSTDGGTSPLWNPQGGELFYREGDKIMVVDVELGESPQLGAPRVLFEEPFYASGRRARSYDVMPDGQHFIMLDESASEPRPTKLVLVQNWFQEIERLVPVE